jgi:hypothetical protein
VPVTSAGIRSTVNWMRLKLRVQRLGERADDERLPDARHALDEHVSAGEEGGEDRVDRVRVADDDLRDLAPDRRERHPGSRDGRLGERRRHGVASPRACAKSPRTIAS